MSIPSDLDAEEFTNEWTSPREHAEPTPAQKRAMIDKTQAALHAIYAGVLVWVSRRLRAKTDTRPLDELAEMLLCYQHDAAYVRMPEKRPRIYASSRADRFEGTVIYLGYQIFYALSNNDARWPLAPHWNEVAHAITLARYQMGAKHQRAFDAWTRGIIARMDAIAPLPEHKDLRLEVESPEQQSAQRRLVMGAPIAPQLLDLRVAVEGFDSSAASREFLRTVDWANNRYLQPPEAIALSSGGAAYREGRT